MKLLFALSISPLASALCAQSILSSIARAIGYSLVGQKQCARLATIVAVAVSGSWKLAVPVPVPMSMSKKWPKMKMEWNLFSHSIAGDRPAESIGRPTVATATATATATHHRQLARLHDTRSYASASASDSFLFSSQYRPRQRQPSGGATIRSIIVSNWRRRRSTPMAEANYQSLSLSLSLFLFLLLFLLLSASASISASSFIFMMISAHKHKHSAERARGSLAGLKLMTGLRAVRFSFGFSFGWSLPSLAPLLLLNYIIQVASSSI